MKMLHAALMGAPLLAIGAMAPAADRKAPAAPAAAAAKASRASAPTAIEARTRADAIVARMTRAEKIALVHGLFPPMATGKSASELIPSAGHIDGIPRLGVPLVRESDASLGVANQVEQRKRRRRDRASLGTGDRSHLRSRESRVPAAR